MMDEATYHARLDAFARLAPGWNSYNAAAISPLAIETARRFSPDRMPVAFWPVPLSSGGMQAEVHQDGYDLEIEIAPDGRTVATLWSNGIHCEPREEIGEAAVLAMIERVYGKPSR